MNIRASLVMMIALFLLGSTQASAAPPARSGRGPSTTGPLTAADCPLSTRFNGKRPSTHGCTSAAFYDDSANPTSKSAKQVCLGFEGPINAKLATGRNYCKRLTSKTWTENMNMRFMQCAAQGKLGRVVWVSKASAISKTHAGWQNAVTFAEMCYWKKLGKAWPQ